MLYKKASPCSLFQDGLVLMAGPCAIESFDQLVTMGLCLKRSGVKVLRGSAFKPRTSPYSFQGFGMEALRWHYEAKKEHGLLIETEVMDTRDVELVSSLVDILRVGARNMQNFSLLKEVGKARKPVILKRGMGATVEEWLFAAEYVMKEGNSEVILCERGIRTFETSARNCLDLTSLAIVKQMTRLPVIADPSHAAGRRDIVPPLAKAAVAAGADGLLIEVHEAPAKALCDGEQALFLKDFEALAVELKEIARVNAVFA